MKVYHGSYKEIIEIDLSQCNLNRDFGRAFYVTNIREQAEYWAIRRGREKKTEGFVTEFTFYDNAFEHYGLKVLRFFDYTEKWLDFVVLNRSVDTLAHDYDIVEGPIADDKVTRRIIDYMNGKVAKQDFLEELKFFKHTHQIAFCTLESLQMLERPHKKTEWAMEDIDDAITQSLVVDYKMTVENAVDAYFESNTYQQLIDESTGLFNKSWDEVYALLKKELNDKQSG
ncbi:hypothetical protein FACS189452_08660 [Bacteroidia bacterium]|nr:hypothetical protein FACS189452_08660 [Bacteroidia bacterium]